ncbi:substrate-binding periplasmic protein [Thalassotalea ganghwensis]
MIRWLLLVLMAMTTCKICAYDTITISTSDWPPYVSEHQPHGGYITQVVREAFAEVSVAVKFEYVPWLRAYEWTKRGQYDALSYWYNDEKLKNDFYLSEPLSTEKVVFFRLKSKRPITWNRFSDFAHLTMGLTRGFAYTKELWQYAADNKDRVSLVMSDEQNFKMLLAERVDLFPAQEVVGWHYIHNLSNKEKANQVETMHPPLFIHTGHLLFPKKNKKSVKLVEQFNKGLSMLRAKGRLQELNERLNQGYYSK